MIFHGEKILKSNYKQPEAESAKPTPLGRRNKIENSRSVRVFVPNFILGP